MASPGRTLVGDFSAAEARYFIDILSVDGTADPAVQVCQKLTTAGCLLSKRLAPKLSGTIAPAVTDTEGHAIAEIGESSGDELTGET